MKQLAILCSISILFCSCSALLYDNVDLRLSLNKTSDSKVYINGIKLKDYRENQRYSTYSSYYYEPINPTELKIYTKGLEKYGVFNLDIEKEGYKTVHAVLDKTRFNSTTMLVVLIPYFLPFEILSNRHWTFPLHVDLPNPVKLPEINSKRNQFLISEVTWPDSTDLSQQWYYRKRPKSGVFKKKRKKDKSENMFIPEQKDTILLRDNLNEFISRMDKSENSGRVYNNGLRVGISAEIVDMNIHYVRAREAKEDWYKVELTSHYRAISPLGENLYDKVVHQYSGEFTTGVPLSFAIEDAMQYQLIDVIEYLNSSQPEALTKAVYNNKLKPEIQRNGKPVNGINTESFFKMKLKGGGTAIALPINHDGKMITSYDGSKIRVNDYVYDNEGDSLAFKIEKVIPGLELAVIKVDRRFEQVYEFYPDSTISCDNKLMVCGFSRAEDEPAYVIDTRASAIRNTGEINILQLDGSYSYLESPVVMDLKGRIIGIISHDIQNYSSSGISFCMPLFNLQNITGLYSEMRDAGIRHQESVEN